MNRQSDSEYVFSAMRVEGRQKLRAAWGVLRSATCAPEGGDCTDEAHTRTETELLCHTSHGNGQN
jgi:hypothetical protein